MGLQWRRRFPAGKLSAVPPFAHLVNLRCCHAGFSLFPSGARSIPRNLFDAQRCCFRFERKINFLGCFLSRQSRSVTVDRRFEMTDSGVVSLKQRLHFQSELIEFFPLQLCFKSLY